MKKTSTAENGIDMCECEEHEHHHDHEHHDHDCCGHDHDHHHDHDHCGCGHDHGDGCSCGHDHGAEVELKPLIIRFVIGAVLFAAGFFALLSPAWYIAAYIVFGYDVIIDAFKSVFKGHMLDEHFLMMIASAAAIAIGDYREGAAVMLFYQIGEVLQSAAINRSKRSINALLDNHPEFAVVVDANGKETRVDPDTVAVGSTIVVRPGEKIPLDGTVISGSAFVDLSVLTGEHVPVRVSEGEKVSAGSVNNDGVLTVKTTAAYEDSTLSRILEMVEHSETKKSSSEKFITAFAKYYTPIVVIIALLLAVIAPLFTGFNFKSWIYTAAVFLVVSCPCALIISVPLAFFAGIGKASKNGVLIKGSMYLEQLAKLKTVAFDKTGTLTRGVFEVTSIDGGEELAELTAYAEYYSNHPIAKAVKSYYSKSIDPAKISDYTEIAGKGISAKIAGAHVIAGNAKLMADNGVAVKDACAAGTIIYTAREGKDGFEYIGSIVISDTVKTGVKAALSKMSHMGIKTMMLTGDSAASAEQTAAELGIDEVYSELLPADKVSIVEQKLSESETLAFVGDGINDAPVLARADIGIAMGGMGSDSAIEAADVIIMNDSIEKIPQAVDTAAYTMRVIRQNIVFILAVKVIIMALSLFNISSMWLAVFADVGVAVIAVLSSMRVFRKK